MTTTLQSDDSGKEIQDPHLAAAIDADTSKIKEINAELERSFGEYLKDGYKPDAGKASSPKAQKAAEERIQKDQQSMEDELDGKLEEIFRDAPAHPAEDGREEGI